MYAKLIEKYRPELENIISMHRAGFPTEMIHEAMMNISRLERKSEAERVEQYLCENWPEYKFLYGKESNQ